MKLYVTFTRKVLLVILCSLLLCLGFISRYTYAASNEKNGKTNGDRVGFLSSIGCVVENNPSCKKNITIPTNFSDVYDNYNEIQKQANFDLSHFKGENCTVYSYKVISFSDVDAENTFANLIVYKDRIIGGDISQVSIGGQMYPLNRKDGKTKT